MKLLSNYGLLVNLYNQLGAWFPWASQYDYLQYKYQEEVNHIMENWAQFKLIGGTKVIGLGKAGMLILLTVYEAYKNTTDS